MGKTEELRRELKDIVDKKKSDNELSEPEVVRRALEIEQLLNLRMSTEVSINNFAFEHSPC